MTPDAQTPADDEFASAFAELQVPSSTPTTAAAPAAPAEAAVSPSAAVLPSTEPAAAAVVPPGEAGNPSAGSAPATPAAGAEASTPTAVQPAATPAEPDLAAQFAALQAELAELKKTPPAAAAPAAAPAATPAPAAPPLYSADEQAIVDGYMKDWSDVAKGEALLRRAEYQQIVGYVFETLRPRLEALESHSETSATRTQYQDLKDLVPDYDQVRDPTLAWIETQPAYLKAAYQQVASSGSAKDVADLITRFKKETSYAAPAATTPAATGAAGAVAPAATVAGAGLAPAAAAAATSLRVVKSSRSDPVSQPDPNDFDAAFKEFASR